MCKLLDHPIMYLHFFEGLYKPRKDVIVYKQQNTLNYSFETMKECLEAGFEIADLIRDNDMPIRISFTKVFLNHIITLKVTK